MSTKKVKHSIECWIIHRETKQILILHVPISEETDIAFWQPITGGVENNEEHVDSCIREVYEETGIIANFTDLCTWSEPIKVELDELIILKRMYILYVDTDQIQLSNKEHDNYKWIDSDQVASYLYWESNKHTWKLVAYYLQTNHQSKWINMVT